MMRLYGLEKYYYEDKNWFGNTTGMTAGTVLHKFGIKNVNFLTECIIYVDIMTWEKSSLI